MAINIADNFQYQGKKPLDSRTSYATLAAMKAVSDANISEGCLAYCEATDKYYKFNSSNTVDETTGKWREYQSGGSGSSSLSELTDVDLSNPSDGQLLKYDATSGKWINANESSGGGGHTIEDSEGTSLTQRDTLQFENGFNASDDSENEKTVVEPNLMTAADMDDVVTPLPSVQSRYQKYSTEEQIVGQWIDGKPIYQKTFTNVTPLLAPNEGTVLLEGVDTLVAAPQIIRRMATNVYSFITDCGNAATNQLTFMLKNNVLKLSKTSSSYTAGTVTLTVQYTKAADTPNT